MKLHTTMLQLMLTLYGARRILFLTWSVQQCTGLDPVDANIANWGSAHHFGLYERAFRRCNPLYFYYCRTANHGRRSTVLTYLSSYLGRIWSLFLFRENPKSINSGKKNYSTRLLQRRLIWFVYLLGTCKQTFKRRFYHDPS
jgi:hypothetical protein